MRRAFLAFVLLSALVACSADGGTADPAKPPSADPLPKNFRITLLSEATRIGHGVALSGDGRRALVSSVEENTDPPHGSVTLWDLSDPRRPQSSVFIPDRGGMALKVALSADGRHAATFNPIGKVTLWDLSDPSGTASRILVDRGVQSIALNSDASRAITGGREGVHLWDITDPTSPRKRRLLAPAMYAAETFDVAMSADGRKALVSRSDGAGGGEVMLYELSADLAEPKAYTLLRNAGYNTANTVALSGDGNIALVGYHYALTYTNFLTYWDLRTWDRTELRRTTGWKIIPDTRGSVLRWEVALDHSGRRALIAQYNDVPDPADPNPPTSDVWLQGLDTLDGFPRFEAPR
jgi:WD40 repeat protein